MSNEDLWKAVLGQIEISISKANFITWFKNTGILQNQNGVVTIGVPNGFAKEWLENKYNHYILKALKSFDQGIREIHCILALEKTAPNSIDSVKMLAGVKVAEMSTGFVRKKIIEKPSFGTTPHDTTVFHETNLNGRYTFENFIVAENNELARAACFAVSQNLGMIYNPLFIYGGVGLGKTHLLQSIGNEVVKNAPEKRIKYITSECFTTELVDSIKNQKIDKFKEYYQQMDLLIIDDIQFLSGREKTQNEFFHIFNVLYQINKQVVISSDRLPKAIPTLEDRLRSRFEGGMITDISRPTLETRIAILKSKLEEKGFNMEEKAIRFVAENASQNIRELEGSLNRVIAYCEFHKIAPSIENTEKILAELIENNKKSLQAEDIFRVITEFYNVSKEELIKKGRKKEISHPRQVMMYLLRQELNLPFSAIGNLLGGRDHTTTLHAFEKINTNQETHTRLKEEINTLKEKLYYS
ncbi:MAG: chromosomal replication initiator protein DnaA [Candidatus Moranbacteria bacterium]|nr:chromosomal replication initiator protein DnaA [Candidatus Moranbacteria bacterium]